MILSIIAFILLFSFLILIHEAGHFFAARAAGVKVLEFGLGLGKKIYGKQYGETEYTLNMIPFGGFVRMLGEEEASDDPRSFQKASVWWRMIITLAGVFMNFVFAVFALTVLFTVGTNPILVSDEDVQRAEAQGIIELGPENEDGKRDLLSIQPVQYPFPQSFFFAVQETGRISVAVVKRAGEIPGELITKLRVPEGLSGPVGIAQITYHVVPLGFLAVFKLAALLSVSLAVMNLLPIPALDGGRFVFQMVEVLIRRKPPEKWENAIHMGGFIFLMGLLLIITFNDILKLFGIVEG